MFHSQGYDRRKKMFNRLCFVALLLTLCAGTYADQAGALTDVKNAIAKNDTLRAIGTIKQARCDELADIRAFLESHRSGLGELSDKMKIDLIIGLVNERACTQAAIRQTPEPGGTPDPTQTPSPTIGTATGRNDTTPESSVQTGAPSPTRPQETPTPVPAQSGTPVPITANVTAEFDEYTACNCMNVLYLTYCKDLVVQMNKEDFRFSEVMNKKLLDTLWGILYRISRDDSYKECRIYEKPDTTTSLSESGGTSPALTPQPYRTGEEVLAEFILPSFYKLFIILMQAADDPEKIAELEENLSQYDGESRRKIIDVMLLIASNEKLPIDMLSEYVRRLAENNGHANEETVTAHTTDEDVSKLADRINGLDRSTRNELMFLFSRIMRKTDARDIRFIEGFVRSTESASPQQQSIIMANLREMLSKPFYPTLDYLVKDAANNRKDYGGGRLKVACDPIRPADMTQDFERNLDREINPRITAAATERYEVTKNDAEGPKFRISGTYSKYGDGYRVYVEIRTVKGGLLCYAGNIPISYADGAIDGEEITRAANRLFDSFDGLLATIMKLPENNRLADVDADRIVKQLVKNLQINDTLPGSRAYYDIKDIFISDTMFFERNGAADRAAQRELSSGVAGLVKQRINESCIGSLPNFFLHDVPDGPFFGVNAVFDPDDSISGKRDTFTIRLRYTITNRVTFAEKDLVFPVEKLGDDKDFIRNMIANVASHDIAYFFDLDYGSSTIDPPAPKVGQPWIVDFFVPGYTITVAEDGKNPLVTAWNYSNLLLLVAAVGSEAAYIGTGYDRDAVWLYWAGIGAACAFALNGILGVIFE